MILKQVLYKLEPTIILYKEISYSTIALDHIRFKISVKWICIREQKPVYQDFFLFFTTYLLLIKKMKNNINLGLLQWTRLKPILLMPGKWTKLIMFV